MANGNLDRPPKDLRMSVRPANVPSTTVVRPEIVRDVEDRYRFSQLPSEVVRPEIVRDVEGRYRFSQLPSDLGPRKNEERS